jgi:hypothetical protein
LKVEEHMARGRIGIGLLALGAAVVVGILAAKETILSIPEVPGKDEDGDESDINSFGESGDFENITPDNSSTLLDSLEGISVPGTDADIVYVGILGLERAKLVAMWGSRGTGGTEPTKFQRFVDLSTDHLVAIRDNSHHVSKFEKRLIESILEDRVAAGEADEDVE